MKTINIYICQPYWPGYPGAAADQQQVIEDKMDALVAPVTETDKDGKEKVIKEQEYAFSYSNNMTTVSKVGAKLDMLSIVAQNLDIAVTADAILIADQTAGDGSEYFEKEKAAIMDFHLDLFMPVLYESQLSESYLKEKLGFLMSKYEIGSIMRDKTTKELKLVYSVKWNEIWVLFLLESGQLYCNGLNPGAAEAYDIVGTSSLDAQKYLELQSNITALLRSTSFKNKKIK